MKVLVTGAAGRLGSVVCPALASRGHEVVASDRREHVGPGKRLRLADLRDPAAVRALLAGCEAVVHLGNIPSLGAGHAPEVVLSDNTAMNANVFQAARELGVTRMVFASSLQVMIRLDDGRPTPAPYTIPYFPLDGDAPTNPGDNLYGLSKELGERLLRVLSERQPLLTCTALRFPFLAGSAWLERHALPQLARDLNFCEALSYLELPSAAELVARVLERQEPGYHQYFPAQALELEGYTTPQTLAEFFPHTPLRRPREQIEALIDHGALERELEFRLPPPPRVRLDRR